MKLQFQMVLVAAALCAGMLAMSPSSAEAQTCNSWVYGTWSEWATATGSFSSNSKVCSRTMPKFPFTTFSARVWQDTYTLGAGWRRGSTRRDSCTPPPYPTYLLVGLISETFDFNTGLFNTAHKSSSPSCLTTMNIVTSGNTYITRTHCAIGTCAF